VILCDLTTCYSIESACFQRLKLKYDKLLSNLAFNFNLRCYIKADTNDVFSYAINGVDYASMTPVSGGIYQASYNISVAGTLTVGRCRLNR